VGLWATTERRRLQVTDRLNPDEAMTARARRHARTANESSPWVQVSRLGNPLINEVIIPIGKKDYWNASDPRKDKQFEDRYANPELSGLVNFLYPVLDDAPTTGRGDLVAVLLTGVPTLNLTGETKADLLRLNTQFTAPPVGTGNRLGLPERTPAGGRRDGHRDPRYRVRIRPRRRTDHPELRVLQRECEPLSEQRRG
jgi:hypothetical protein